ncbi:MAG: peptidoglycan-binding protein [Deltaproteobacteria bacterium]|nr:peptidoglycan-binding protein [Deltaproteobacteria bacterium]
MRSRGLLILVLASCGGQPSHVTQLASSSQASAQEQHVGLATEGGCVQVIVMDGGREKGTACAADARAKGLTVIDLTDTWTPTLFAPTGDQVPAIRDKYLELAAEKGQGEDALSELYGVVPALAIVRARLSDDARHTCQSQIDPKPILALDRNYTQDDREMVAQHMAWRDTLDKQRDKLAGDKLERLDALDREHAALVTVEQKLRCEGWLLDKDTDGSFTWRTGNALEMFQRRNFLMPTEKLDEDTRNALQLDSHELDFRLALRILRERVVDASGILEDGTAAAGPTPILGRDLDPPAMRAARGHITPLPNAAADLVGPATEAAAKALGWTDPAATRAFLDRHGGGVRVAVQLPSLPAYYAPHMELSAEIDRGDIFYDETPPPFRRIVPHRPTLTLYVDDHGTKRPLIRWPTTIGGWADQRLPDGTVVQRWKESDVGPRIWRDIFAGPTWLPPKSTPDKDLVKNLYNGHWALKSEILGPGPHAAYGMVLIEHLQHYRAKDGTERFDDNGIGTHGSASVTSIVNGTSHGCHRLYNQLAVRLGDFLLRHRDHAVRGEQILAKEERFKRIVFHNDESFKAEVTSRGFLYELTPPVPVNVLKGNIISKRKVPPALSAPASN